LHHLSIANGSLHEVETHIVIAERLGYIEGAVGRQLIAQCAEIGRLIYGLMRSLRTANEQSEGKQTLMRASLLTDDRRLATDD